MDAEQNNPEEITWANRVSNLISEKMKDGFFGYLIVSFVIHNWQQILIIIKSKKPIELVLHSFVSQPDFTKNAFWIPMGLGVAAAFIMPWILAFYVQIIAICRSRMASAQHAANEARNDKLKAKKEKRHLDIIVRSKAKEALLDEIGKAQEKLKSLSQEISIQEARRGSFTDFFERLNEVYRYSPEIKNIHDFKVFFEKAYENDIFDDYPRFLLSKDSDWIKQTLDKSTQNQDQDQGKTN